jgi:hypothetical protein
MNDMWIVELTPTAEDSYRRAFDSRRGNPTAALVALDELIDDLKAGRLMTPDHTLRGSLSWIYQAGKDRTRIFYAVNPPKVIIFHISNVVRGDDGAFSDPYPIFAGLVMSGQHDQVFEFLGVGKPPRLSGDIQTPKLQ